MTTFWKQFTFNKKVVYQKQQQQEELNKIFVEVNKPITIRYFWKNLQTGMENFVFSWNFKKVY